MDGTFTTTTLNERRKVKRSGHISSLFVLIGLAVGLHVALFAALDAVVPLGADVVGDSNLVIQSGAQAQATAGEDAELERVFADAR